MKKFILLTIFPIFFISLFFVLNSGAVLANTVFCFDYPNGCIAGCPRTIRCVAPTGYRAQCEMIEGQRCSTGSGCGAYRGEECVYIKITICVCTANSTQSLACGNCGTKTRTCAANCLSWGAYGSCTGQGVCSPGSTDSQACGWCGTKTRTCTSSCTWGSYGGCEGQGVCAAGDTDTQACGSCGTRTRTCSTSVCAWESWGTCTGQGVCSPGSTKVQGCGSCGTQTSTCTSACAWGTWGTCQEGNCFNPPNTPTLIAPPNSVWINYNPTYQATTTDPDNDQIRTFFNVLGYGDGWGNWVNSGQTSSWGPLNVGTCYQNWWRAYAQDTGGLNSSYSGYWLAKVDKDIPSSAIAYTTGTIYQLTFPITLTESDACSGILSGDVEVRSKLTSSSIWSAYQDYSATIDDFIYTGQSNYQYQFRYRAADNANNWSDFAEGGIIEIKLNNPPTAAPSSEVFIYCADSRHPVLHFTYADPDGDVQGGYMIQVDNNADFSSLEDDTGWHYTTSTQYTTSGTFDWNTTYYWRVKVMDSKNLESSWSITDNFKTPLHAYPSPDFTYLPRSPSKGEEVRFTDNSSCFDDKPLTTECSPSYSDAFFWDFDVNDDGLEGVVPLTSILENPIASYSNQGLWYVKLEVRDKDNYICSITKQIRITYPLPKWREVKPD